MAKATVKVTTTKSRTRNTGSKSSKGSGTKRCPTCGRYR